MPDLSIEQLQQTAYTAAWRAGQIVRDNYAKPKNVRQKKGPRDLVTDTDGAAQEAALTAIQEQYPNHTILAEEAPSVQPDEHGTWPIPPGVVWAVDPLDGTTNYTTGLPFVCVSVGVAIDREPVVGVIYDPLREEAIVAGRGLGATLNGQPLSPLPPTSLIESVAAVDWSHAPETREHMVRVVLALSRHCRTVRALGSAALAMAYVACRRVQLYANFGLQPWDTCAAAAIIQATGGELWQPDGGLWQFGEPALITGHPKLLAEALRMIEAR